MLKKLLEITDVNKIAYWSKLLIILSGGLNAAFSVIILIIAARTLGIEETGVLSIAIAISKLVLNIGKYGMRNYQITETKQIAFSEWLYSRFVSVILMMICVIVYIIYQKVFFDYTEFKIRIIFFMCVLYASECFEDLYTGHYQKIGRLDISSYIQIVRYVILYIIFGIGFIWTHDLFGTLFVATVVSCFMVVWYAAKTMQYLKIHIEKIINDNVKYIMKSCLPLCIVNFILIYLSNAPKYEIDKLYSSEVQAYFGFISMPIFTISLFSGFIFQPQLVNLTTFWAEKNINQFKKIVTRQYKFISMLAIMAIFLGATIGIPVLEIIYGVDGLDNYKYPFLILLIAGVGTAFINFLSAILTIFRKQKNILQIHILVFIALFISIKFVIRIFGIMGAVTVTAICTWLGVSMLQYMYLKSLKNR